MVGSGAARSAAAAEAVIAVGDIAYCNTAQVNIEVEL